MKSLSMLYDMAAARKGGAAALEKLITKPKSKSVLKKISDDRFLAGMTRVVFQAVFSWR